MLVRRFFIVLMLMVGMVATAATAFSQDISGHLDGYYEWNLNRPPVQSNAMRAFDVNHNNISLNYAELVLKKDPAKFGYRFDLGIGDAARLVHAFEPTPGGHYQYIQQAFISAKPSDRIQVDFGKFVTPFGAEVIETPDNWNYSRGLLFTWAVPFYHMGLRATIANTDELTFSALLVNGWNNVTDNNRAKSAGGGMTWKPADTKFAFIANYMGGIEGAGPVRHAFDAVLTYELSSKVSLMANYDYVTDTAPLAAGGKADWKGVAGYAKLALSDKFTFVPRYEWFRDTDGTSTGFAQTLQEITLTGQIPLEGDSAKLWLEVRRDWNKGFNSAGVSDPPVFPVQNASALFGGPTIKNWQTTFLIGVTYSFTK